MLHLLADITSTMDPTIIYGREGDELTIISTHGDVCIVERQNGKRFPCNKNLLSIDAVIKKQEAAPDTAVQNKPIINRVPVSKIKAAPLNQKSLF